jgi:iron complex outermembrane receptor protein
MSIKTGWSCRSIVALCLLGGKVEVAEAQEPESAPVEAGAADAGEAPASDAGPTPTEPSVTAYEPVPEIVDSTPVTVATADDATLAVAPHDPSKPEGDVIIVTAQFREQNPQKTPLAMTVLGTEQMRERNQVTTVDLGAHAPNVNLSPGTGVYGPAMQAYIRGVGQHDFNFALEPGVGVYVDDVYYSTLTGSIIDLMDLERVEVLRGPQGTLAGQNSIGGAIRLFSRKPQGGNNGYVQTTYGRYDRLEVRAAGDFTLVKHKLFGRISGVAHHSDGYVTRYDYACTHPGTTVPTFQDDNGCKLGTEGGRAYAGTRASFRWTPTNRVEVTVTGDYTKDNSESTPNTLLYVGTPMGPGSPPLPNLSLGGVPLGTPAGSDFISYSPFGGYALDTRSSSPYANYSTYTDPAPANGTNAYGVPPVYRVDSGGASGRIEVDLPKRLSLTSITAYRQYSGEWSTDEGTPIGSMTLHNVVSSAQATEELRFGGKLFGDAVDFTVGGFYLWRESRYGGRIGLPTIQFLEDSVIPAQTAAGFGNIEYHVTDALDLIAGARYTWQEKEFEYGRDFVPGAPVIPPLAALNGTVGRFEGSRGDYRGAVQYQWVPQLMTYGQVATGFKGGGVNARPFAPSQAFSHEPETMVGYEIGAKSDWFDDRLRLNAAAFFNQYKDIVVTVSSCPVEPATPCFAPLNAGKAHVMGFELEGVAYPIRYLGLDGSVGYLNFEYDSISAAGASSGITLDMKGPYAPKMQARGGVRYHFLMGSWGSLTPRLDLLYQSAYHTNGLNSRYDMVDHRTVLNGRVTWSSADDTWQAALELTNITNSLYYLNVTDARSTAFMVNGQPAPPFRWALSLRRNFM